MDKNVKPEQFDGYDCQERPPLSDAYRKKALPQHLQDKLAKRGAEKPTEPQGNA
jgi:hypothetical protein